MARFPRAPGVTFLAAVPGALAPPTPRVPSCSPVQSHETPLPQHILIVDEDRALVQTLRAALEPRAHVEAAPTGAAALESAPRHPFDLVLPDDCLPDLLRVAVHHTIKQTSPSPQVILLTNASNAAGPKGLWERSGKLAYLAT